jgi:hypothetical protein
VGSLVVVNGAQQGHGVGLAVHEGLSGRDRDEAVAAVAPLPDGEANQLEAGKRTGSEVHFRVRDFGWWISGAVEDDVDGDAMVGAFMLSSP